MPIYDQTYRHIDAVKESPRFAWMPMIGVGTRLFFRDKRRLIPGVLALIPFAIALIGVLLPFLVPPGVDLKKLGAFQLKGGIDNTAIYSFLTFHTEWFAIFLYSLLAGAGLVTNDLKANALELYFSRPLTLLDYFLGKLGTVLAVLFYFTLGPCLLLWILDISASPESGRLWTQLPLLPRIVAACFVATLPYATIVLAISALARSQRLAVVGFAAIVFITRIIGDGEFARLFDSELMYLVSLPKCVDRAVFETLGVVPGATAGFMTASQPLDEFAAAAPLCVVAGWIAVSVFVFFRRVRAIEVIAT